MNGFRQHCIGLLWYVLSISKIREIKCIEILTYTSLNIPIWGLNG